MEKTDSRLKTICIGVCLWLIVLGIVGLYLYFDAGYRQARRESIYIKARALAAQQQRQRFNEYRRKREAQRLNTQYNQGRVVNAQQAQIKRK